ncbi:hypothetical protein MKEN_00620700 [Mycena kentingensis (nom. inval.)]|nr:hypothetical protein MKEN_00620700 [Mycena kentingensis (nom. inval.)]
MASRRVTSAAPHFPAPSTKTKTKTKTKPRMRTPELDDESYSQQSPPRPQRTSTRKHANPLYEEDEQRTQLDPAQMFDDDMPVRQRKRRLEMEMEDGGSQQDDELPTKRRRLRAADEPVDEEVEEEVEEEEVDEEVDMDAETRVKKVSRRGGRKGMKKQRGGPKRRSRVETVFLTRLQKKIYSQSRALSATINPFVVFSGVIDVKRDDIAGKAIPTSDVRFLKVYEQLSAAIPELDEILEQDIEKQRGEDDEDDDESALKQTLRIIQESTNAGKHADTSLARTFIEKCIPLDPKQPLSPAFHLETKADRGFKHPETRRLLIPQSQLHKLDEPDSAFVNQLRSAESHAFKWTDSPALMYDQEKVDPKDIWAGILCNAVPIRLLRAFLHGKSKAFVAVRRVKGSTAERSGIKKVTPHLIAYAHIHAYFACSTAEKWTDIVDAFDLEAWYDDIIDLLKDEEDEFVQAILAYWNKEVFGTEPEEEQLDQPEEPDTTSNAARLRAALAARKAQRASA